MRAACLFLLLTAGCSCDDGATASTSTPGTGAGGGGAAGAGAAGAGGSTPTGPSSASGAGGVGGYIEGQDSTYITLQWPPGCGLLMADSPQKAVPPLAWESCGSACEKMARNFPAAQNVAFAAPSIFASGGYNVSVIQLWQGDQRRSVLFNPAGVPEYVFKTLGACSTSIPERHTEGLWLGVLNPDWVYVFEPWDAIGSSTASLSIPFSFERATSSSELLALRGDFSTAAAIYDRTTGQTSVLGPPSVIGSDLPQPVGEIAFALATWAFNRTEAWAWSRGGGWEELIDRTPKDVVDVKSDGELLVWIESPERADPLDDPWAPGTLYKSPVATTAADLTPAPVRLMPAVAAGALSAVGGGYYAVHAGYENTIQIVRLSDGYGWNIPIVGGDEGLYAISFIDENYLFYRSHTEVVRIALGELGPPAPPP